MIALRDGALRQLIPAAMALVCATAAFATTAAPVRAAPTGAYYVATLASPLAAPRKMVEGEVLWNCAGTECSAARDTSRPAIVCARLAGKVGLLSGFATPKGAFSAEDLARCNGTAS